MALTDRLDASIPYRSLGEGQDTAIVLGSTHLLDSVNAWCASLLHHFEVGGRVSCVRPIQNNSIRALLQVSTSGTPYILHMNFTVDLAMFLNSERAAKANYISDVALIPPRLFSCHGH